MTKLNERRKNERSLKKNIIIIYHGDCSDGFGAAWAAWKKFGDSAEYFGAKHKASPPQGLTDKEIYFVDFVYSEEIMEDLKKKNRKVTAIDHHISAQNTVQKTQDYSFDLNHSGAVLSWKYFHSDKPTPKILEYIEDTDLWKFELPHSKEVFAFLDLFDFSFNVWDKLASDLDDEKKRKHMIESGSLILSYEQKIIGRIISKHAETVKFEGFKVLSVNSLVWASQIGNELVKKMPPLGIVWYQDEDGLKFSLRSDGSVDVSKVAQKFEGGGHKTAAGFLLPYNSKFPWKKIKN